MKFELTCLRPLFCGPMLQSLSRVAPWALSALLLLVLPATAQETPPDAPVVDAPVAESAPAVLPGHSMHGETFDEGPRQAAQLLTGTGEIHFSVTSEHPDVQKFVEQGIGQLHGFWYLEAERSFRQAAFLDSKCGIALWGAAMANVNNPVRAKGFIVKADALKESASDREKRYITALHTYLHAEDGDQAKKRKRAEDYIHALEDIALEYPDDLEATAFLIFAMWDARRDELGITSHLAVESLLADLFERAPNHPAHHYRIHLWDYKKPEKALASSALCGQAAPGIAHMWHMPGHIYSRLNRYEDAVWQQEASARVDHAHQMRFALLPDQIHNYAHNNEWLIRNLSFVGRVRDGVDLACNLIELPRHPKFNRADGYGSTGQGRERLYDLLAEHRLWEQTLQLSETRYLEKSEDEEREFKRQGLIASSAAMLGQADRAAAIHAELTARLQALKGEADAASVTALAAFDTARPAPQPVTEAATDATVNESPQAPTNGDAAVDSSLVDATDPPSDTPAVAAADPATDVDAATDTAAAAAAETTRLADREKADKEARKPFESKINKLEKQLRAIEGFQAWAAGDMATAHERLKEVSEIDGTLKAELRAAVGEIDPAIEDLNREMERRQNQVIPLAVKTWVLEQAGRRDEALLALEKLRETSSSFDLDAPLIARLAPLAAAAGLSEDWRKPRILPTDLGVNPELSSLGPFRWTPIAAPSWELLDSAGESDSLASRRGRPVVVIFYLGAGCLHCVEQLEKFAPKLEEFTAAGIEVVAISSEDQESLIRGLKDYGKPMPIRLLSNGDLTVFRDYRCFDDFEQAPMHGTFLIDAEGQIRWHDIGPEPFMEPDFVLSEAQRLLSFDGALQAASPMTPSTTLAPGIQP